MVGWRLRSVLPALAGLILAVAPAAAQSRRADIRAPAIPDFDQVATQNRGPAGFYLAGGLGYGFPAGRQFSLVDGFACPGTSLPYYGPVALGGASGCNTSAGLGGTTFHVLAGWNTAGPFGGLAGFELRGRLGSESGTGRLGGTSTVAIPGLSPYVNAASGTYRAALDGGVALTARYGLSLGGFVPFVRAGLGAAHLTEDVAFDATGSRACQVTVAPPAVSCVSGGRVSDRNARWLPSAVLGAGLEIPIGRFFARVEGEVEAVFSPSQNLMRTVAGQALVSAGGAPTGGAPATVGQASLRSENWIVARRIMISGGFRF